MRLLTCSKCGWVTYEPPQREEDYQKCVNCGNTLDYSRDISIDEVKALPVDWSKHDNKS